MTLTRTGNVAAFEALVQRYESRLLGFCRQMLRSTEDAEDVLQEVFVAAYNAMCADERPIAVKPWLYRIARNRSLNHLRKPTADGVDSMDILPHMNGISTHERVTGREEFRDLLKDVGKLPETQRSALLLREIDAMSYEEIAQAMDTTVPGVKSLLVRARIALTESTEARRLTCGEVRLELAEAAEGLGKASGPVRRHVKECDPCREFRSQLRSDSKVLAAIFPIGPIVALKAMIAAKLGGGAGTAGTGSAATAGTTGTSTGAGVFTGATAVGGSAVSGGAGAVGAALGTKAAAGLATAALLTAGVAEVNRSSAPEAPARPEPVVRQAFTPVKTKARPTRKAASPEPATRPAEPREVIVAPEAVPEEQPVAEGAASTGGEIHKEDPVASANTDSDSGGSAGASTSIEDNSATPPPSCDTPDDPACAPATAVGPTADPEPGSSTTTDPPADSLTPAQ